MKEIMKASSWASALKYVVACDSKRHITDIAFRKRPMLFRELVHSVRLKATDQVERQHSVVVSQGTKNNINRLCEGI